jgi:hypothetical protein
VNKGKKERKGRGTMPRPFLAALSPLSPWW